MNRKPAASGTGLVQMAENPLSETRQIVQETHFVHGRVIYRRGGKIVICSLKSEYKRPFWEVLGCQNILS